MPPSDWTLGESTARLLPFPVKTSQPLPLKARLLLSILPGSVSQGSPGSTPAPASPLQFLESDPSTEHEFPPFNKYRRVTWASRMLGRRDPGRPRGPAAILVLREATVYGRGQTVQGLENLPLAVSSPPEDLPSSTGHQPLTARGSPPLYPLLSAFCSKCSSCVFPSHLLDRELSGGRDSNESSPGFCPRMTGVHPVLLDGWGSLASGLSPRSGPAIRKMSQVLHCGSP
ncbi:uncharacterized protein LOC123393313 [Mustela putorius furo]|uniref:Uncharacterized protein LOC123393313 n=1 Tax=Mustela putorius furo TaxID=9669 RepID=A0A8U0SDD5_MUSPF|nr:uncharacterized protein LOC123393313 [Mustela putorius furo]